MKFDTGLWDRLFGERITLQVPGPHGQPREVSVTRKWLALQERQGSISPLHDVVPVSVADPFRGCYEAVWKIGEDVDAATVKERTDPETGRLYAMVVYEQGEPKTYLCDPGTWAEAKRRLEAV